MDKFKVGDIVLLNTRSPLLGRVEEVLENNRYVLRFYTSQNGIPESCDYIVTGEGMELIETRYITN